MTPIDVSFCTELLKQVGDGLHRRYTSSERSSSVSDLFQRFEQVNDWATQQVRTTLAEKYPAIQWSDSEFELDKQKNAEFQGEYWICDAIDGAVQFLQGICTYTVSLCLIRDERPVLSFIYAPSLGEMFHAVAGEGAYLNGQRIQVAKKTHLEDSIVCTTPPSLPAKQVEVADQTLKGLACLMQRAFAVRMLGSISLQLAYTACGRLDGYFEFGDDFYDWIAGALLVQEAGGVVSDVSGNEFTWGASGILASNPPLHQEMKAALHEVLHEYNQR